MKLKLFLVLFLIGLTIHQTFAQEIDTAKIDDYISYIAKNNQDVGNISIFKNGQEVYNRSFGQSSVPMLEFNENTKYHIGSITKLFTATLIWHLIEQKKLKLNKKLAVFFPDMPNAKNITIKNLLEHSSGLGDYVVKQDSLFFWLKEPVTEQDILTEIRRRGTLFEPGDSVSYSNSGYYLLARIVEKEYNDTYASILKRQITKPLQLLNTYSIQSNPTNVFDSYAYANGKWKRIKDFYYNNVVGVGDIVSTPKDLNQFIIQLFNYKILSKETLEKMKPIVGKEEFGRGLQPVPFYQYISYGHGGDTYGSHSLVSYNPKNTLAISFAINGQRFPHNDFIVGVLNIIHDFASEYPNFSYTKISPEILKRYLGTYSSSELPIKLTISENGGILTAQGTGQPSFELQPIVGDVFKSDEVGVKIEFKSEQNLLILKQYGKQYEMKKAD